MISKRTIIVCFYDLVTIPIAWLMAYWIRFNLGIIPEPFLRSSLLHLPLVIIVQGVIFWAFGLYRGHWRFASIPDLVRIIKAVLLGAACILLILFFYPKLVSAANALPPRSIMLLYILILILLLGGARLFFRWLKDLALDGHDQQRALIVGAGAAGEALVRDLFRDAQHRYRPIAFVDDNKHKQGAEIHGVRVVGKTEEIPELIKKYQIDLVLIAMPSAPGKVMRKIVDFCNAANVSYRTLPGLSSLASGEVAINDLREVSLEDLLGREAINLRDTQLVNYFQAKKIVVTGGGGSIGSELCRQLAVLQPAELIILEHSEYNLYAIEMELRKQYPALQLHVYLQDITEAKSILNLFQKHQPDVVFHAAAYKHVPMLEAQVRIAMKNNVLGTRSVAEAAVAAGAKEFVLISTDKAVNPTNVMGASKRIAELFCQNYNAEQNVTGFVTVRFGNVLGSAGSVVPLFKKQIETGGPVTVTHPEITRYFMMIPEASQLILQASLIGKGGEIFVLDMGEPLKITYLAEQLIKLSGKRIGDDIEIKFTGLRPGEKLYEELFHEGEPLQGTQHEKILQAESRKVNWQELIKILNGIQAACDGDDETSLLELIKVLVPENKIEKISI